MGILNSLNPLKNEEHKGLSRINDGSDRVVYRITDPKQVVGDLLKNWDYRGDWNVEDLKGEVLKKGKDNEGRRKNIEECETWTDLSTSEKYRSSLCPVRACFNGGEYLVMDYAVFPAVEENYSHKDILDFCKKLRKELNEDFGVSQKDIDLGAHNIGWMKGRGLVVIDYPWIKPNSK